MKLCSFVNRQETGNASATCNCALNSTANFLCTCWRKRQSCLFPVAAATFNFSNYNVTFPCSLEQNHNGQGITRLYFSVRLLNWRNFVQSPGWNVRGNIPCKLCALGRLQQVRGHAVPFQGARRFPSRIRSALALKGCKTKWHNYRQNRGSKLRVGVATPYLHTYTIILLPRSGELSE